MSNFAWWWYSLSFTHSYHSQWRWLYFKVTAVSNIFYWKFCSYWINLKFWGLLIMSCRSWIYHFLNSPPPPPCSREITFRRFRKNFNIAFFLDTVKARSFKLCMIITLLGVYIFIIGLMTMILFQSHRFVFTINCKLCCLDPCLDFCLLCVSVVWLLV